MSGDRAAEAKRLTEQAARLREEIRAMEGDAPAKAAAAAALKEKEAAAAAAAAAAKAATEEKELSENMKAKLRKELISQGADPNRSSGNGILIVAGESSAVALLTPRQIFCVTQVHQQQLHTPVAADLSDYSVAVSC
jgi:hypothetical protein